MTDTDDPGRDSTSGTLRVVGGVVLLAGIVLTAIGIGSFVTAFNSSDGSMPGLFWMAFLGLPLVGIGIACLQFGFAGRIGLFAARQSAPAIREVMRAVRSDGSGAPPAAQGGFCTGCGQPTTGAGRFCAGCGASLT